MPLLLGFENNDALLLKHFFEGSELSISQSSMTLLDVVLFQLQSTAMTKNFSSISSIANTEIFRFNFFIAMG